MPSSKDKLNLIMEKAIPALRLEEYVNMIGGIDALKQSISKITDEQADKLIGDISEILKS